MSECSPGERSHADQRNFTLEDYLAMCRTGEAKYSASEVARILGVSRMQLQRYRIMASIPAAEFDAVLADARAKGRPLTTTAVSDEIKRRHGKARTYVVACPHCGGTLRERRR